MEIDGCDINNLEIIEDETIIFKDNDIIAVDKVAVRKQVSIGSRYYNYKNGLTPGF